MIKMVITLKGREGMTHDDFTHYQQKIHRPLLMSIPESERYPEPEYDSVVEAWFDTMADLEALFFSESFLKIVDPDHENFIDLSTFGRIICEEDVILDRN